MPEETVRRPNRMGWLLVGSAVFWGVMNVLLWQEEYGARRSSNSVPTSAVWEKILSAADRSVLGIRRDGRTIGTLEWTPSVLENARTNTGIEIEGLVDAATGYHIQTVLRFFAGDPGLGRLLVQGGADFGEDLAWRNLEVRVDQRPRIWNLRADAGSGEVVLEMEEGRRRMEQRFQARDLSTVSGLLGPLAPLLPSGLGSAGIASAPGRAPEWLERNLRVDAAQAWMKVGSSRLRVYKVTGRFGGSVEATAYVSRAGEILKVQLPDNIQLVNDALATP